MTLHTRMPCTLWVIKGRADYGAAWPIRLRKRQPPQASHVDLLSYCHSIVHFNTEIANRAFDLGMAKQQLDGPQVARSAIDQGSLGST